MPPKRSVSTSSKKTSTSVGTGKKSSKAAADAPASSAAAPAGPAVDGKDLWMATDALQKTKAMRNYFQLERDRIIAFWDITKKQLDDVKEQLREKAESKAEQAARHEVEKKIFHQKIRQLLYEHQVQLSSMKEEAQRALATREEELRVEEHNARSDVWDAKVYSRALHTHQQEQHRTLTTQQDKEIAEQQAMFEREIKELHAKNEHAMRVLREEMDRARKEDLDHLEQRKEQHIAELKETHERTFKEVKDYYSEITSNNLETVRALKDEVYARKRTEAHNEKSMQEVAKRNKKLTEPLAALQRQKKQLLSELEDFAEVKEKLTVAKQQVKQADQELQTLSWEHEVLLQRYTKLTEDRDIIMDRYNAMVQDIQRKAAFRRVLVQKKLELAQTELEGRDAKLTELLKRANLNPDDVEEIEHKIHDLLLEKDKVIDDLKELLMQMTAKNEAVVSTYESYLTTHGVSGYTMGKTQTMTLS